MNNENGKRKIPTLFSHIAHNRNDDDDDDEDQVLKTIFSVSLACLLAQPLMVMAQSIESSVVAAIWSLMSISDFSDWQSHVWECMQKNNFARINFFIISTKGEFKKV